MGELDLTQIEFVVGDDAGDVIEAELADMGTAEQQREVFGVCVGAGDEPVEAKGGGECVHVGLAVG